MLVRDDFGIGWCFLRRLQVFGDGLIRVNPDALSVSLHVGLVEDSTGKQVELFVLQRLQKPPADFGRCDNLLQRDAAHLPLLSQMLAKGAHGGMIAAAVSI
jgi:hypothetical protein